MIFVTVGTHDQGFERLVEKIDEIAGKTDERVVMQIGYTKHIPRNAEYFDFIEGEKMQEYFQKARIVVSHAGAGTLIQALSLGKPIVIVPRSKKLGEAYDDHQLDFAEAISGMGKGVIAYDVNELEDALDRANKLTFVNAKKDKRLVNFLKECIKSLK